VIHVYGVVEGLRELPHLSGVDDAPLERRRVDGLELVVSRSDSKPTAEVSRDVILRHAEVVEELMHRSRSLLPAQLARTFADEEELATAVEARADDFVRGLERVRGCVEFGLRVIDPREPAESRSAASSGADYMRERLAQVKHLDGLLADLHAPLVRLARANVVTPGAPGLRAAYLVPKRNVPAFREAVEGIEAAHPELAIVSTGPWPPYSFADRPQAAA
jgi:hypothetical protein